MPLIVEIEAKLMSLTPRQCQVLYWICHGYRVKELASAFHFSKQTIHWDIGRIYEVFGLKVITDVHEKRRILEETVCPIHWKLVAIPDVDCSDRIFQKGEPLPPDPDTMRMVKADLENGLLPLNMLLEDPQMKKERGVKVIQVEPGRGPNCRFLIFMSILGAILVALVVLIFLVMQLLDRNPNLVAQGIIPPSPTPTIPQPNLVQAEVPTGGAEPAVSLQTLVALTSAASAPVVPSQTPPPPAATPTTFVASPKSSPQSAQCPEYQFSDDFEGNLKPDWKRIGGQFVIIKVDPFVKTQFGSKLR